MSERLGTHEVLDKAWEDFEAVLPEGVIIDSLTRNFVAGGWTARLAWKETRQHGPSTHQWRWESGYGESPAGALTNALRSLRASRA
jgi:hypothetical protein